MGFSECGIEDYCDVHEDPHAYAEQPWDPELEPDGPEAAAGPMAAVDEEGLEDEVGDEVSAISAPERPMSLVDRAVAAAVVDFDGWISCPIEPWASFGVVGRLTTFPQWKPPAKRTTRIQCRMHPGCVFARSSHKLPSDLAKRWLFSCEPPTPFTPLGEVMAERSTHRYNFALMCGH